MIGVVLASCLQEVFGIHAISSTKHGSELFNVYGPVRLVKKYSHGKLVTSLGSR